METQDRGSVHYCSDVFVTCDFPVTIPQTTRYEA